MTKFLFRPFLLLALGALLFTACVPARQLQDEKAKREKCEQDMLAMTAEFDRLKSENADFAERATRYDKQVAILEKDTTMTGVSLRKMTSEYDKLNSLYELLLKKNQELLSMNAMETQKISTELMLTQEKLNLKEEELRKLENELNLKKQNLDALQLQLADKERRIIELEAILNAKDSTVQALKDKLSAALIGFENNGLTIVKKNGKVYVSMDESLLFASGSWAVNAKGKDALIRLAKVLEANPDVNIMIEGHTDNVPYKGNGQVKDNWDLSVMRATAVAKIILDNSSVAPSRLIAAGRSEYVPVDSANSSEARTRNRRTEIILTPKLDELLKILEDN